MDIDKLFKAPKLPVSGGKRKLPDNPTPEMLKKMKFDYADGPSRSVQNIDQTARKGVTIEEVQDEDSAQSSFAPGNDADYFVEEDEEGRFFGGGLTAEQKEILNIFDSAGTDTLPDDSEELTISGVRRILLRLERAINTNQDQRSKYPNTPERFIESEADLDVAIKALFPLAQNSPLSYPEIIKSGSLERIVGLLSHDNVDIVIDAVELIHELTDEDVGGDTEDESFRASQEAQKALIDSLLQHSVLGLLVDNLSRMNEKEESDRQGVFHVLAIFESILGFDPKLSSMLVSTTGILSWLLNRIQSPSHDDNRGYAAELISILLQDHDENKAKFGEMDGVETSLKVLSQYRRRDPVDTAEEEFMENIFDTLCSALSLPSIKQLFVKSEGPDLMILMMKEKRQVRSKAIKVLDFSMSGTSGSSCCDAFVDALGLKTLFSAFMSKSHKKSKSMSSLPDSEEMSHILGIISSLFSNIASDSPSRIRLLAKFVENNYEKVDKLLEIRDNALGRLQETEDEINKEREILRTEQEEITQEDEDLWYLRRLDGGLFILQNVDYILAWLAIDDDGILAHMLQLMKRKNQTLQDIVKTLKIYHDNADDSVAEGEDGITQKSIISNLITALAGNDKQ